MQVEFFPWVLQPAYSAFAWRGFPAKLIVFPETLKELQLFTYLCSSNAFAALLLFYSNIHIGAYACY